MRRAESAERVSRANADVLRAQLREREAGWSESQAVALSAAIDVEAEKKKTADLAHREARARNDLKKLRAARTKAEERSHEELAERVVGVNHTRL